MNSQSNVTPGGFVCSGSMKLTQSDVFHHITGNHPLRELTLEEANKRNEPCWLVGWQQGFEVYSVAVYGDGLCDQDAIEAAEEFYPELGAAQYCNRA